MQNDMLGRVVRKLVQLPEEILGTLFDFLEKLSGNEGAQWLDAFKRFLRKENPWLKLHILKRLNIVNVPAVVEGFIFEEKFTLNNPDVQFVNLSHWFSSDFVGKSVTPTGPSILNSYQLLSRSPDAAIITELAGGHETFISQFYSLLLAQGKSQSGPLCTDGRLNMFFINGKTVYAFWESGWDIGDDFIDSQITRPAGAQVFAH